MTSPHEATPVHLERNDDVLHITAAKLLVGMAEADDDVIVLASDDEEGNDFRPIAQVKQGLYLPQQMWFGYFWEHPGEDTTLNARMLYERMVADRDESIEATLFGTADPGVPVENPKRWPDLKRVLADTDPESVIILRHHTSATLHDHPPSYSPLVEVDTAHYLRDASWSFEFNGTTTSFPAERIVKRDHYEDEETRMWVEDALSNPDTQPAYFFWPLN